MTTEQTSEAVSQTEGSVESTPAIVATEVKQEANSLDGLKAKIKAGGITTPPAIDAKVDPSKVENVEKPVFNPNFKYQALKKEFEVEEWLRGAVKDQDTEKKIKDLLTKSHAFEDYKTKNESLSQTYNEVLDGYKALDTDVKRVMGFRNNGDLTNFFAALKISKNDVFDWARQQIQLEEASPEERANHQRQAQDRERLYSLEQQNSHALGLYEQASLQARTVQLDMCLNRQDVSEKASSWDQRVGKIGAFRELVIGEARLALATEQVDLSAEEAVERAIQKYGKFLEVTPPAQSVSGNVTAPVTAVTAAKDKPVIPVINSGAKSPVRKQVKSIDDIKKRYEEIRASEGGAQT
jgi:hypothetical protein